MRVQSSMVMPAHCKTIFSFPETPAEKSCPRRSSSLRIAVTTSSLTTTTTAIQETIAESISPREDANRIIAPHTTTLSSNGSSTRPTAVTWLNFLAHHPSSTSLSEIITKREHAVRCHCNAIAVKRTGDNNSRTKEIPLGTFTIRRDDSFSRGLKPSLIRALPQRLLAVGLTVARNNSVASLIEPYMDKTTVFQQRRFPLELLPDRTHSKRRSRLARFVQREDRWL